MNRAARSRVGSVLDEKYELLRRIGSGGMSEVYEARHLQIGRRVAIKFLLPDLATRPELIARFRNEAKAAGALQHENIAAVYDVGELDDGMQYLVMELLTGTDCAAALQTEGRFDAARAIELVVQLCRGLSVAHALGIVHRDLKPANLFMCQRADGSDLLKIFDFGIAKLKQSPDAELSTGTGAALGTPCYMSPEQARGDRDIDARTDVYAAGVILYEFLTGRRPFDGSSSLQILHRILTQTPAPLGQLRSDLPVALTGVVHQALAKEREQRFASAAQLLAALQPFAALRADAVAALDETQPDPDPDSKLRPRMERLTLSTRTPPARRAKKLTWLLVASAALSSSAIGWWRWTASNSKTVTTTAPATSVAPIPQPSAERADAGRPLQPSAAPAFEPAAKPSEPSSPNPRPAKRAQHARPAAAISVATPALPPPPVPDTPAPEARPPEAPARTTLPGRLSIDHSNPYH